MASVVDAYGALREPILNDPRIFFRLVLILVLQCDILCHVKYDGLVSHIWRHHKPMNFVSAG